MKTLALIENELFKDYVKIVSTDNLEEVLDNPNVPVPYTCIDSVINENADTLLVELTHHFEEAKVKNKDFFVLNAEADKQLKFLLNIIKISSGQLGTTTEPKIAKVTNAAPVEPKPSVQTKLEVAPIDVSKLNKMEEVKETVPSSEVKEEVSNIENTIVNNSDEDFDPFAIETPPLTPEFSVKQSASEEDSGELITELGIPKNAIIHFVKDESITAQMLDEKTVIYEDQTLSLTDAAKLAFKKVGSFGMAGNLSNWSYNGVSLKDLKEQANK